MTPLIIIYLVSALFPLTIYFLQLILNKKNEKICILLGLIPLINTFFTSILICAGISVLREEIIKKKYKNNPLYAIMQTREITHKPYVKIYEKSN